MKTDKRIQVFETMPVRQAVLRQIIPAIASQMIALIYNLADTYFVGMLTTRSRRRQSRLCILPL